MPGSKDHISSRWYSILLIIKYLWIDTFSWAFFPLSGAFFFFNLQVGHVPTRSRSPNILLPPGDVAVNQIPILENKPIINHTQFKISLLLVPVHGDKVWGKRRMTRTRLSRSAFVSTSLLAVTEADRERAVRSLGLLAKLIINIIFFFQKHLQQIINFISPYSAHLLLTVK